MDLDHELNDQSGSLSKFDIFVHKRNIWAALGHKQPPTVVHSAAGKGIPVANRN
jgi:hypothetical protein